MTAPRIKVFPADRGGCGWNRIIWPAEALKRQGADIQIVYARDPDWMQVQTTQWHNDDGTRLTLRAEVRDCDIAVLQRPLTDVLSGSIEHLQAQGVKVVVDIDDDFESISPRNISFNSVHPRKSPTRNWQHLARACEQADLVVVSTPALADVYGRHGRVAVVPNYIPAWYLDIPRLSHQGEVIGWSGSIETHPDDLQVMGPSIAQLEAKRLNHDCRFRVVGTGRGVRKILGLTQPPLAAGWVPIEHYPTYLADYDVGVVPLELTRFNEAKSYLKGLEMAAVGTPVVASPTWAYLQLERLGLCETVSKPKHWAQVINRLLDDPAERAERGAWGRQVAATLTYDAHCGEHWDAWSSVVGQHALSA